MTLAVRAAQALMQSDHEPAPRAPGPSWAGTEFPGTLGDRLVLAAGFRWIEGAPSIGEIVEKSRNGDTDDIQAFARLVCEPAPSRRPPPTPA